MRFLVAHPFKRKEYIKKMDGTDSLYPIKTMLPIFKIFNGDVSMDTMCVHCRKEEDGTEHLLTPQLDF